MTRLKLTGGSMAVAFVLFLTVSLRASDPVGVYGIVNKVVFEPSDAKPTAVQIWGAFSFAVPRGRDGVQQKPPDSFGEVSSANIYGAPQKGYLYYVCPNGKETVCQNE